MINKKIILILGESTGLECFKAILNLKLANICQVVSTNQKYDLVLKNICKKNKIFFCNYKNFPNNLFNYNQKKTKFIIISIFSNLILKPDLLKKFNNRCYNLHPGLLPYYPGQNCVSGVIFNLEKKTGITLHIMDKKVDQGNIIYKKIINIKPKKETLISLMLKLKKISIILIKKFVKDIYYNKKLVSHKNYLSKKKKFPKFIPNKGLVNKNVSFQDFEIIYRASYSGPFKNTWGKVFFKYKNIKNIIEDYELLNKKNKYCSFKSDILKINEKKFILKLKDNIIRVKTF